MQPDGVPYVTVVINKRIVGYLHFNGNVVDENAKYSAQLTFECFDNIDEIKATEKIAAEPTVSFMTPIFRRTKRSSLGYFAQFRYDTGGQYVSRPVTLLKNCRKWLVELLTETQTMTVG